MRKQSFIVAVVIFMSLVAVALTMRGHGGGLLKRWLPAMHGAPAGH